MKEFVHGFFKVYYSNLETKIKLAFDMYDFDRDGYIHKEDIRLVMSYVPVEQTVSFTHLTTFSRSKRKKSQERKVKELLLKKVVERKYRIGQIML